MLRLLLFFAVIYLLARSLARIVQSGKPSPLETANPDEPIRIDPKTGRPES
jgi:hypothetical protein